MTTNRIPAPRHAAPEACVLDPNIQQILIQDACRHTARRVTIGRERVCTACGRGWEILDDYDLS
jgi:hypothetical protein